MGSVLRIIGGLLTAGFLLGSTATVTAQFAGLGMLASRGFFSENKLVRYAGVLYGVDPLDMEPSKIPPPTDQSTDEARQQLISEQVRKFPAVARRLTVIRKGSDDIRNTALGLKIKRERQDLSRKLFENYLQQIETENRDAGLREVQITLESLPPKDSKDIVVSMLADIGKFPDDDVLADVVHIVKTMPQEKLRKVLAEFKTDGERELLHRILVEIGDLTESGSQLTGTTP